MRWCLLTFALAFAALSAAQDYDLDSLLTELDNPSTPDTQRVFILSQLCSEYKSNDAAEALRYGTEALQLAEDLDFERGLAASLTNLGGYNYVQSNFTEAIELHKRALEIRERNGWKKGIALSLNQLGLCYDALTEYEKSVEHLARSLKINKELGNDEGIASCLNDLGTVFHAQGKIEQAMGYYRECLAMDIRSGDPHDIANSYNNIGSAHYELEDFDSCMWYFKRSMQIREDRSDMLALGNAYNNIGSVYFQWSEWDSSLYYMRKALMVRRELGDKYGIANSLINKANVHYYIDQYDSCISYTNQALQLARSIGSLDQVRFAYHTLFRVYRKMGQLDKALDYHINYVQLDDSISNEQTEKVMAELEAKYENEKNLLQIENLKIEGDKQRLRTLILAGGLGLLVVLIVFVLRGYRQKQKANKLLESRNREIEQKNEEITLQRDIIEEKNKDITDSIRYAKRIQDALLVSQDTLMNMLPDHFLLFKPKDVVSGDFYWAHETADGKLVWAVCDCTGHGVPGAFMSMIGNSLLNEIVIHNNITDPGAILDELRTGIINAFSQSEHRNDGMDVGICVLDKAAGQMKFAGAHRPLYCLSNGELTDIGADRQPVGHYESMKPFTTKDIPFQKGNSFYVFSDGYVDQFGGDKGKKMKTKPFKEFLLTLQDTPMSQQGVVLDTKFDEWKGDFSQVDDVCVLGVKL